LLVDDLGSRLGLFDIHRHHRLADIGRGGSRSDGGDVSGLEGHRRNGRETHHDGNAV
jgi:hypothetical protein